MTTEVKKISELTATTTANSADLMILVTDTDGTPTTQHLRAGRLLTQGLKANFANTSTSQLSVGSDRIVIEEGKTPSSASMTITQGSIFYDNSYMYVAIANNTIKRVALSSW
jgi:hypothetical protein